MATAADTSHLDTKNVPEPGVVSTSQPAAKDTGSDEKRVGSNDQSHHSNLGIFQDLVGIRTPSGILDPRERPSNAPNPPKPLEETASDRDPEKDTPAGRPKRESFFRIFFRQPRANRGIYGRAIDEEWKCRLAFHLASYGIGFIYLLQIFIAASITGLAAFDGTKIGLTILGAANTVLAGLMAFLKGQGLPNRMLKSKDQYRNIIDAIEDTERMFCRIAQGPPLVLKKNPFEEADKIVVLFNAARKAQQDNYPDIYVGSTTEKPANPAGSGTAAVNPASDVAKRLEELEKKMAVSSSAAA
jgi:SMODS and SLOG-associating 2TM effector domain